jgi:hypothetical protein
MRIGYACVSIKEQSLSMQVDALKNRPPGNPAPYEKKQFAHTLAWRTDTGRLLFGG